MLNINRNDNTKYSNADGANLCLWISSELCATCTNLYTYMPVWIQTVSFLPQRQKII